MIHSRELEVVFESGLEQERDSRTRFVLKDYLFQRFPISHMASLLRAKTLGEVGSILILLGLTPDIGLFIAIAGLVLTLIAVKYISQLLGDPSVFRNMLIAVVLFIGGAAAAEAVFLTGILSLF